MLALRVPQRLHAATAALGAALAILGGACAIETYRLADARHVESTYQHRCQQSERALQRTRVYYARVQALAALDRRVEEIVVSGNVDARLIADIADQLPTHAWLISILHDQSGITIEGRARDLSVVADVIRALMRCRSLRDPTLTGVQASSDAAAQDALKYVMHAEVSNQ